MPMRVLFTQGLSNVYDAIMLIRQAMKADEFHITASYSTEFTPLKTAANRFLLEPRTANSETYMEWLLDCCQRYHINLLWPQSRLPLIFAHLSSLCDAGITVLLPCADHATLATLNDKARTAEILRHQSVKLPDGYPFQSTADLDRALAGLEFPTSRVCIKPAVSICAQGFRIVDDNRDQFTRFLHNDVSRITVDELKALVDANHEQREFLAMEYLEGDERSIDCLAIDGRLVRCVTRRKPKTADGRFEIIEADPASEAIAAKICAVFGLNGLVNVQTRERLLADGRREQCFLEVNARMSGGVNMACQSGVVLPYWALRLMAGTSKPEDIPFPRTGLVVTTVYQAVSLGDLSTPDLSLEKGAVEGGVHSSSFSSPVVGDDYTA